VSIYSNMFAQKQAFMKTFLNKELSTKSSLQWCSVQLMDVSVHSWHLLIAFSSLKSLYAVQSLCLKTFIALHVPLCTSNSPLVHLSFLCTAKISAFASSAIKSILCFSTHNAICIFELYNKELSIHERSLTSPSTAFIASLNCSLFSYVPVHQFAGLQELFVPKKG